MITCTEPLATDVYAGALFFSPERADEVLHAWCEWTATAPAETTSVVRIMRFGDGHEVADLVRGRSYVLVEAVHLGSEAEGAAVLQPLRELRGELDTFSIVPRRRSATCIWSPSSRLPGSPTTASCARCQPRRSTPWWPPPRRRWPRSSAPRSRRLLHARFRHADRRGVDGGDRGPARARGGRAGGLIASG